MAKFEKIGNIPVLFRGRQENNKDILCVITGEKGDGKSNTEMYIGIQQVLMFGHLCLDCGHEWVHTGPALEYHKNGEGTLRTNLFEPCPKCNSKNIGKPKFNFRKYLAYDGEDVMDLVHDLEPFSPLLGDEMARWALAEDWASKINKEIKKAFIQIRTKNLTVIGCIPEFVTLDKKHRNMANYWIRIMQRDAKRSLAVLLEKDKGEFEDKWHLKEFQEIAGSWYETTSMEDVLAICKRLKREHPCVFDYFFIPHIDKKLYAEYEKFRDEKVFERSVQAEIDTADKKEIGAIILYNLQKNYPQLVDSVAMSRKDVPTLQVLEDVVCVDPLSGSPVIRKQTVGDYIKMVEKTVRFGREMRTRLKT